MVGFLGLIADGTGQVPVLIPAGVVELDETHAALGKAAGEQAVRGEGAGILCIRAVELLDRLRLTADVGDLRHAGLHPESHLVLGNTGFDLGIEFVLELDLVESGELVQQGAASGAADTVWIGEVENRVFSGGETHALVAGIHETGAPETGGKRLVGRFFRNEDDEAGQVLVCRAKAVGDP